MKTSFTRRKMLLILCVFLLAESLCLLNVQAKSTQKTIRVAYPIQEGITDVDESGRLSGYTYEYLEEIAQYTGWNYEFVQVDGSTDEQISQLMEMVQTGEVDLMGAMLYSEALNESYDYSSYSYGTVETVLQVLSGNEQKLVIDASRMQKIRVAVRSLKGNQIDDLYEYCNMNLIEPELIQYQYAEELYEALENGTVDAMLTTSMNFDANMRTIARFSPKQFYFVTSPRENNELLAELNEAMMNLHQMDPYFQSTLYDKYFAPEIYDLSFNEKETAYLKTHKTLKAGILTNLPPFQAVSMTRPYVKSQYFLLMKKAEISNDLQGKVLALPKDYEYPGVLPDTYTEYETMKDCIDAVDKGEADYTYADLYVAQYFTNLPAYDSLKMVSMNNASSFTSYGISAAADRSLLNIINKVILSIPQEELQSIINSSFLMNESFSIDVFIKKNPIQSILFLITGFLILLGFLLYILQQRNKAAKASALELQRHMRLYAVTNDVIFEYDYQKQTLMVSIPDSAADQKQIHHYDLKSPLEDADGINSRDTFRQYLNAKENGVFETQLMGEDQKYHWYKIILEIIRGEHHEAVYAIGRLNQIDAQRKEHEELIEKANKDSLTHLFNIGSMRKQIRSFLENPIHNTGALLLLDIDEFKSINDTYGHLYGDEILLHVSSFLKNYFGSDDIIGRPGGDEFLIFMPHISTREELETICTGLCRNIHEIRLKDVKELTVSVGASLSFSKSSYEDIYKQADDALYHAKKAGRDRYHVYDPNLIDKN